MKVHILVFSLNSPSSFENYEAFRLAPSRFPDGEGEKEGRSLEVHNALRQTASATEE
ncbi:MAG: hypothetical protein J0M05_12655 [Candidatus Kapabacteria bacterium]|nr:hypothetical protein [Candidatus Kapabacteria bacterium]